MRYLYLILYYLIARNIPTIYILRDRDPGLILRNLCAKHIFKSCGKNIYIGYKAYFGSGRDVEIGNYSAIGLHCHVPNNIKIGNFVMMGPHCYFLNSNGDHKYQDLNTPMMFQGKKCNVPATVVGDDVWFGRQCLVLSGKSIGSHSIVAAGSVVCKNITPKSIWGGNPIKFIKDR